MPYWLMKSEPDELSILHLQKLGRARWDGVRNYQARNFLRSMQPGELFFFYHSSCPEPGIAGIARIAGPVYPDPTAIDPQSHYFDAKASTEKNPRAHWTWSSSKPSRACCRWRACATTRHWPNWPGTARQPAVGDAGQRGRVARRAGHALSRSRHCAITNA